MFRGAVFSGYGVYLIVLCAVNNLLTRVRCGWLPSATVMCLVIALVFPCWLTQSLSTNLTVLYAGYLQPFDAHCCNMDTALKHPVPNWVKRSFVILTSRHSDAQP